MNDHERYIKDRATVMSIIKYLLIAGVSALLIFFALRIVSVLVRDYILCHKCCIRIVFVTVFSLLRYKIVYLF